MQSPVDIKTASVKDDPQLLMQELHWNYVPNQCTNLYNTGNGWKIETSGNDSFVSDGPLENAYRLLQFHCHWGRCSSSGSEHTVDGKAYAGELHFVHWNAIAYPDPRTATESSKGLAVIAVFLQEGKRNEELAKISDLIESELRSTGDLCILLDGVNPSRLLPDNREYWTYEGSLTTPDYNETVTWIVFKHPIEASLEQLEAFRSMISSANEGVEENCREIQDLNGRVIRSSPIPNL